MIKTEKQALKAMRYMKTYSRWSRFLIDPNLTQDQFEVLFRGWIRSIPLTTSFPKKQFNVWVFHPFFQERHLVQLLRITYPTYKILTASDKYCYHNFLRYAHKNYTQLFMSNSSFIDFNIMILHNNPDWGWAHYTTAEEALQHVIRDNNRDPNTSHISFYKPKEHLSLSQMIEKIEQSEQWLKDNSGLAITSNDSKLRTIATLEFNNE